MPSLSAQPQLTPFCDREVVSLSRRRGAWTPMAGVQNLTDEDPPYVPDVSVNTSGIFDFMGAFYYARASVGFE